MVESAAYHHKKAVSTTLPPAQRASLRAGGLYEPEADPEGKGELEGICPKLWLNWGNS